MFTKSMIAVAFCISAAVPQLATAQNWHAEIYGGSVLDRSEDYDAVPLDMDSGTAIGVGLYNDGLISGLELGVDLMRTDADYTGLGSGVESLSAMIVGRVDFPLAGATTGYVGAGLGAIRVKYDGGTAFPAFTGDDTVAGAQVSLGIRYAVGAGVLFGELKHQAAFDDATIQGRTQSYATTSALAGFRFSF